MLLHTLNCGSWIRDQCAKCSTVTNGPRQSPFWVSILRNDVGADKPMRIPGSLCHGFDQSVRKAARSGCVSIYRKRLPEQRLAIPSTTPPSILSLSLRERGNFGHPSTTSRWSGTSVECMPTPSAPAQSFLKPRCDMLANYGDFPLPLVLFPDCMYDQIYDTACIDASLSTETHSCYLTIESPPTSKLDHTSLTLLLKLSRLLDISKRDSNVGRVCYIEATRAKHWTFYY